MEFDLSQTDALLSTTRSVRKRLDLDRDVPTDVLLDCLQLAVQAPSGNNRQGWRWMVVRNQERKDALADLYRRGGGDYLAVAADEAEKGTAAHRAIDSANYLAQNLERVPVLVIPLIIGRLDSPRLGGANNITTFAAGLLGSILPAVWSFQLALRSRGLGSCYTTLHLQFEEEAADLLGIPDHINQAGLLPVAYTLGTDFTAVERRPVSEITYLDHYKNPIDGD
ncbi:nitroreductase family protein [Candidatus Poriferisocius sp.]|uniref:nitroreductase family protein n=1 Tax=Candidatus Poriferisocius sp. TaxID=3101276 RepID=UPI003B017232